MRVVVDKNNPLVGEAFRQFGDVQACATREITKESVRDADIIIIRSETKVTKDLLDGSKVKFVGTATIGTDHVDLGYLRSRGIGFASAPGSNANSVAEYFVAGALTLAKRKSDVRFFFFELLCDLGAFCWCKASETSTISWACPA